MSTFLFYLSLILIIIAGLYSLWMFFFMFCGLFMKNTEYSETSLSSRFAVIICARNEENVIGNLIHSLKKQDYPSDRYDIFTVAHNCTDRTAEIAAASGANVLIRNCPEDTQKGDAIHYALHSIQKNAEECYDAFVIFDADNLVSSSFLTEINKALATGADVIQGFRAPKNYDDNLISKLFGLLWMGICYEHSLPHSAFHLPVIISGTGFAAKFSALEDKGWQTKTLCEDIEFSIQQMLSGHQIIATRNAVFYDEQPTKIKTGFRQRFRWTAGISQCFKQYFIKVVKAIPKRGMSAVKIALDILLNPVLTMGTMGLLILAGLMICKGFSTAFILKALAILLLGVWVICIPLMLNILLREKMSFFKNLDALILFPCFLFFSGILALIIPFCHHTSWKPIVHESTKTLEDLEN